MHISDTRFMNKNILLAHGSGGKMTQELIRKVFLKQFDNPVLNTQSDSSILTIDNQLFAFTTDSYVIDPLFFPGGNIGKLAVCGTVNDLSVSGAKPLYLSASFIIEEGFPVDQLEKIVESMQLTANEAEVPRRRRRYRHKSAKLPLQLSQWALGWFSFPA